MMIDIWRRMGYEISLLLTNSDSITEKKIPKDHFQTSPAVLLCLDPMQTLSDIENENIGSPSNVSISFTQSDSSISLVRYFPKLDI